jgi:hypothetical protein
VKFNEAEAKTYFDTLVATRLQKDIFFKTTFSPLTNKQEAVFQHLSYFPANLDLIF